MKKITYTGTFTVGCKKFNFVARYRRKNPEDSELIQTTDSKGRILTDDQEDILAQCYDWDEFCDMLIDKGREAYRQKKY